MPNSAIRTNRLTLHAKYKVLWLKAVAELPRSNEEMLSIGELSHRVGVSQRTLRNAFASVLGVSPTRYLALRRLHLLRAALSIADPLTDTVASIARAFGFSDCGRMAAQYRRLFGEPPRTTLLRNIGQQVPHQLTEHSDGALSATAARRSSSGTGRQNGRSPKHRTSRIFR